MRGRCDLLMALSISHSVQEFNVLVVTTVAITTQDQRKALRSNDKDGRSFAQEKSRLTIRVNHIGPHLFISFLAQGAQE